MNKKSKFLSLSVIVLSLMVTGIVFAVHNLYPDNGKTTSQSTFHSLNDLFNLVADSANPIIKNTPDSPVSTTTIPTTATTTHSISEIYAILANMVKQENIATSSIILGVAGDYGIPDPYYATTTTDSVASLEPTVSTNTKTDYSLEDIWNLIQVTGSTKTTPGSHTFPVSSEPNSSMHTTSDIYNYISGDLTTYLNSNKYKFIGTILGVTGNYTVEGWIREGLREGLAYYWDMENTHFNFTYNLILNDPFGNTNFNLLGETRGHTRLSPTHEGEVVFTPWGVFSANNGAVGKSITFNSSNDYYRSSAASVVQPQFTVAAWIRNYGYYPGPVITSSNYKFAEWDPGNNNSFSVLKVLGADGLWKSSENQTLSSNEWHYVVGVWDGSEISTYIDGVKSASTVSAISNGFTDDIKIGTSFTGGLDEVAVWNRALSQTEISQLYNGGAGTSLITP